MTATKLLLDEQPLQVVPSLARKLGLNEAIVIQQLHWAMRRDTALEVDGKRWVKLSTEGWQAYFTFWSFSTIRRTFASLRDAGLIETSRGREANVYTINYETLNLRLESGQVDESGLVNVTVQGGQVDQSPCKREGEREEERVIATGTPAAAPGELQQLPGMPPPLAPPAQPSPSPSKRAAPAATNEMREVWDYFVRTFGDRLQLKELTEPRIRTLNGAFKATNGNVPLLKAAVDGLKAYRTKQGDDGKRRAVNLDVIFKTNPRDQTGLTEKIEWWASHAEGGNTDVPSSVPSAHRSRVLELAVTTLAPERRPDDEGARERAEEARMVLAERFKLKVKSDGSGKLAGWEPIA